MHKGIKKFPYVDLFRKQFSTFSFFLYTYNPTYMEAIFYLTIYNYN